ncbi:hypothetical protein [Streptomyces sp. AcE210]|uniref:hypothetical protein n=1 Tax=Streptomyces sp. AcE210 TaxID=2292703 RepID=UPI001404B514|nr:hypothetical protein [Streptomyces sp. AcE210]
MRWDPAKAIDTYLLDGTLPERGTTCSQTADRIALPAKARPGPSVMEEARSGCHRTP